MYKILSSLAITLIGAVLFGLMPATATAAVTLPHTHHFNSISPWGQVYSNSNIDTTTSAPNSPSSSLSFKYPSGMANGTAPDKVWLSFTPSQSELWTQYWFKYSNGFYFHTVDNKQMYWYISGATLSTNWYISCSSNQKMRMVYQRSPGSGSRSSNTGYNPTIEDNVWYKVTTRAVLNTNGASNGIFQLWINGGLVINYSDVPFLTGDDIGKKVGSLAFDPVFGGMAGLTKPATDYLYVDHVQIQTGPFDGSSVSPPPINDGKIPLSPSDMTIQ